MKVDEVSQILAQIRELSQQSRSEAAIPNRAPPLERDSFSELLGRSIEDVNRLQTDAAQKAEAFERGDPNLDIASVMVAMQKASLSFQAVTQVRNRLVSAYQDIMNMPV